MTSRRPMTRSYSGNGRTSSFSEDESGPSNGRNTYLSNVRPENRSTLCSVMAQLTEDIQPSFETTLKSKAVSENCNVKFSCVVSGYPAPELKWYKDDMEMDRYCGLPKYEIRKNGKTHTLHIYNCTLDDAAIYQVSASNSKGIVSCSGVLEVGTMNEYKIHQRFFAKLKQKAEKKKKDMDEQNKKETKENVPSETVRVSPERPPRKRQIAQAEKAQQALKEPEVAEQLGASAKPETKETSPVALKDSAPERETPPSEDTSAKKKIKITNGLDSGGNGNNRSHMMGNGGENCYDGGMSLAQFLAETLQSQSTDERPSPPRGEKPKELDKPIVNATKEKEEQENNQREQQERGHQEAFESERKLAMDRERDSEEPVEASHAVQDHQRHHGKAHKDHDHHHIPASISSMLHTVKDFFFGKGKKDPHDHGESRELGHHHASTQPYPQTPPSYHLRVEPSPEVQDEPPADEVVPMETDKLTEPRVEVERQSLEPDSGDNVPHIDATTTRKSVPESRTEPQGQRVRGRDDVSQAMEVTQGPESSGPGEVTLPPGIQVHPEADEKAVGIEENAVVVLSANQPDHQSPKDESPPREALSDLPQAHDSSEEKGSPESTHEVMEESRAPPDILISAPSREEMDVDKTLRADAPDTEEDFSSNTLSVEEKTEVKSNTQQASDINRSETPKLAHSQEEGIETMESEVPIHTPPSPCATEPPSLDRQEAKSASPTQEMNVGFPPAATPEMGDLKIQRECTAPPTEASEDVHKESEQSLDVALSTSDSNGALSPPALEKVGDDSCENLKVQEQAAVESKSADEKSDEMETEGNAPENKEEARESEIPSVEQNELVNAKEKVDSIAHPDGGEKEAPPAEICSVRAADSTDINPADISRSVHVAIPKIEIFAADAKDTALPLTFLALDKPQEPEPALLQERDATGGDIQERRDSHPPGLSPTQHRGLSPAAEDMKEIAQSDDKAETTGPELARAENSSERLPRIERVSVPVISVSCSDDKEAESGVSDAPPPFETPPLPFFVVPPISVTCHESESEVREPAPCPHSESDTSQRGTNQENDHNVRARPERPPKPEQTEGKSITENTSSPSKAIPTVVVGGPTPSKTEDNNHETPKAKTLKEAKIESYMTVEDLLKSRTPVDRLSFKPPTHPSLSPASLRKFMSRSPADPEAGADDKVDEDMSGGSTPTSSLSCESSPRLKRRDSLTLIRSATPEELASGARRKIFIPKAQVDGDGVVSDGPAKKDSPYMSPSQARRAALLQAPMGQNTPPMERRSPLLSRRKAMLEVPKVVEQTPAEEPASTTPEEKPAEKKYDPLKAPQVIRKIRGEPFPDASGHLKLWCQFFNVLADSTIKWYRDEEEILEMKRSGSDETQVALAIVLASNQDCGVYGCTIKNEYGTDTTDFLLSTDILAEILLKDDLEVGEEIEMTPLLFTKGLANCGNWGDKYFGRIMTETLHLGEGPSHKASRVKVIYGLDPVFESGSSCIIKVQNPIAYGTKSECNLSERNQEIVKQECKVQNMIREYCKIFAAEARVIENFGASLEVIPQYLMYRPANSVPYATVEAALDGEFLKYCELDAKGKLMTRTVSEVEQKCCTFQHWIHQWTHGNLLATRLAGVEMKITNVRVVTKSKGYQGLTELGSPEVFEGFLTHHQCNYYCGLLSLRPLKTMDTLQQPKLKGSRSPLLNRKLGSSSPQLQRKGTSPQLSRKASSSPKVPRKVVETETDNKSEGKPKPVETLGALEMR